MSAACAVCTGSTAEALQLEPPQRRKHHHGPRRAQPDAQVCALRADLLGDRALVVHLAHAEHRAHPPDQERRQRRHPVRQPGAVRPGGPVEPPRPAEDGMLLQRDDGVDGDPVPHERQEVLKDAKQAVAAGHRAGRVREHADARDDPARGALPVAAQHLEPEHRRVRAGDVVGDEAQGHEDAEELAEAPEPGVPFHDERPGGHVEGVRPRLLRDGPGAQADADEVRKRQAEPHADGSEHKRLPLARVFGVVDVKVGACWGPGYRRRQTQREKGQPVPGYGPVVSRRRDGGVKLGPRGPDQHEEGNQLRYRRPSEHVPLVDVKRAHAKDHHDQRDDGDNDSPDNDA
ncbi:hypothetical protein VFPFJ_02842 [Purpureocillium lilacinum]|uniref:Uncharacterized protein n=1 Tax=Purpureocillium lilacinum TaxID=33203 RepID=A0A179HWC1_PURLI|nr:hypothetical protein VFPFJ_02842 [Purpureocillium lilacinum]OAQ93680.1 hypothetical protein VFPFJ_02842 [Purpureocillium lilacinum]